MNAVTVRNSLAPASIGEMMKLSEMLAGSSMVPQAYKNKPQDVLIACLWGSEVGLGPIQALNGISVINGKPAIWGDAALALVRGHPACQAMREGVEGSDDARFGWCEVTRRGQAPERRTFSVAQAKKAGLWGKQGPWVQYPDRMLQMRARGFAIRDVFPDALRGVITAEEAQDMPTIRDVTNMEPGSQSAVMAALQAPDTTTLPLLGPDGNLYDIGAKGDQPAVFRWLSQARKCVAKLEDAAALRSWRAEMGQHFATIAETEPEAVKAVEDAVEARLTDMEVEQPADGEPA